MKKKRRINRSFNCCIAPRATDIDRVEHERNRRRNDIWISKGAPK